MKSGSTVLVWSPIARHSQSRPTSQAKRQAEEATRHPAPSGAPARLHARSPRVRQRAGARRGLLPRARHRDRGHRPWRQGHLPRTRTARRLSDHARRTTSARICARWRPRSWLRWPSTASTRAHAAMRASTTRACGSRIARSPRSACTSRRGVSTHGFAVNVTNDLEPFSWIVPCGLPDVRMTSVERELGHAPDGGFDAFAERMADCFCEAHGRRPLTVAPERIGIAMSAAHTLVST